MDASPAAPASVTSSDDWSRQVETDEAATTTTALDGFTSISGGLGLSRVQEEDHHPPEAGAAAGSSANTHAAVAATTTTLVAPHPPPPLSRKEEAIARERQRRIETERARFKQRFVNTRETAAAASPQQASSSTQQQQHVHHHHNIPVMDSSSVAETIESTMVHADDEQTANPELQLGFNMERFLRNSQDFQPNNSAAADNNPTLSSGSNVLMERFLQETPVVVTAAPETTTATEAAAGMGVIAQEEAAPSDGMVPDTPVLVNDIDGDVGTPILMDSDRAAAALTHSVLQAMEAMEETSIANAPPSEREEMELLSEVGDLPEDFVAAPPTDTTAVSSEDRDRHSETTPTLPPHLPPVDLSSRPTTPPASNQSQHGYGTPAPIDRTNGMMTNTSMDTTTGGGGGEDDDDVDAYTPWSPPGKMNVSPLHTRSLVMEHHADFDLSLPEPPVLPSPGVDPLLDVPPEIITTTTTSPAAATAVDERTPLMQGVVGVGFALPPDHTAMTTTTTTSVAHRVFWNELPEKLDACHGQSAAYTAKSGLQRVWNTGRPLTFVPTVLVLGPTLWIIKILVHGSLCVGAVPLSHVITWLALLPLHLALTRQLQLGTSLATLHGVGFRHVTVHSWKTWVWSEMAVANLIGIACAIVMLLLALIGSGGNLSLGIVAAFTQLLLGLVAGAFGCHACLLDSLMQHWRIAPESMMRACTTTTTIYDSLLPLGISLQDLLSTIVWMLVLRYVLASNSSSEQDGDASLTLTAYCDGE